MEQEELREEKRVHHRYHGEQSRRRDDAARSHAILTNEKGVRNHNKGKTTGHRHGMQSQPQKEHDQIHHAEERQRHAGKGTPDPTTYDTINRSRV